MANKFAVLVGTNKFKDHSLKPLFAPTEDVTRFREVLLDPNLASFDDVQIYLNSDLATVRSGVAELFAARNDDDLVLFYYSGHGLTDARNRLYFSLMDTDSEEPSTCSLEASYLHQHMDDSSSRRQVIILDCCHSGAFKAGDNLLSRDAANPSINEKTFDPKGHGRFILTASAASESSFEENGKSIYTQTLIDGLKTGEAAPDKEEINLADLHNFVSKKVKSHKAPMQPHFWVDNQTEPLIISQNPNIKKPTDEKIIEAVKSEDPFNRLGGISELRIILSSNETTQHEEAKELLREMANNPNELMKVVNAANEALGVVTEDIQQNSQNPYSPEISIEEGVENHISPDLPKEESVKPLSTGLPQEANDKPPPSDLQKTEAINVTQRHLFDALQSAILVASMIIIFFLILYPTLDSMLPSGLLFFPILIAGVNSFEIWRRDQTVTTSFIGAGISLVMFFLISIFLLQTLISPTDPSHFVAKFCLQVSFLLALVIGNSYAFTNLRKLKIFGPIIFIGIIISLLTSSIDMSISNEFFDFILGSIPLISIMFFLVFSVTNYSGLRSIRQEIRTAIHNWNAGN